MSNPPAWLLKLATTPLRTRRLVIRPLRKGDDRAILPAVRESLKEIMPWLPWASERYDAKAARAFVRAAMRDYAADRGFALGIFTRDGSFVGGTGFHLHRRNGTRFYEIGYWCRSSMAGRGYTTEAAKALLRLAFRAPEVHRVEIRCDPRNRASERVIRKCGLPLEGHLRKVARDGKGKLCDHLVFAKVR
jgi:RimJ/RimL family protein N-acetyltransferase